MLSKKTSELIEFLSDYELPEDFLEQLDRVQAELDREKEQLVEKEKELIFREKDLATQQRKLEARDYCPPNRWDGEADIAPENSSSEAAQTPPEAPRPGQLTLQLRPR